MPKPVALILLTVLFSAGCGKHSNPSSGQAVSAGELAQPQETASVAPDATPPATGADLNKLTGELRRWCVMNKRTPKTFEEFASASNLQVPPPPQGKKYALGNGTTVVLVNR